MRVRIPTKFRLMNREWTVSYTPLKKDYGQCRYEPASIVLRPGMNKTFEEHTFLHELYHAIADALGWEDFNRDEGKIDALAGAIHQFLQTKSGTLK